MQEHFPGVRNPETGAHSMYMGISSTLQQQSKHVAAFKQIVVKGLLSLDFHSVWLHSGEVANYF